MSTSMTKQEPPYPPTVWALGGPANKRVDIPLQSVFLFLFILGAVTHMVIYQKNRARGHKFLPNVFMFGFCMARNVTSILRIASVCLPHDLQLAIAAQIFVAAGVLIIFIINIIFAMRLVRATHPKVGWHPAFDMAFKVICVLVVGTLAAVITGTVQSFYTLNTSTKTKDRDLQLYGSTFLAIIATLPLPMTLLSILVPYRPHDRFGSGRLRTKVTVLLISTILVSLGAWYRCGTSWLTPVPRSQPLPTYFAKAPFYIFNFLVEILVVFLYAALRIDLRWHVPDGAEGPGSYSRPQQLDDVQMQDTRPKSSNAEADIEPNHGIVTSADKEIDVQKAMTSPSPDVTERPESSSQRTLIHSNNRSHLLAEASSTIKDVE